ncbi:hemolysin family protein [Ktedonospora formicarum]|uniref:Membrane protein n=1 Tax=Ktedonospora formicarum TaxID=2778364 RepID=A0A8J3I5C8_9CHLR|nr:hemolysin family protein [Ktedonospora formicarum]GHO45084.1 membrane protein [Ktedonospora formicarum]
MDIPSLLGLLSVFVLVGANAFFVAAEFALVKVRETRIEQLVAEGSKVAKVVRSQLQHLDTYIAATQLGITLASLALGWVGEPALGHLVEPLFLWIGGQAAETITHSVAIALSFALITAFHIIMGELVPKSIALQRSERTALFVARPLSLFATIFRPFIKLMNGVGNLVVRLLGFQVAHEHDSVHTVEELEMLVTQSQQAGLLQKQEEVLLRHIFTFSDKSVQQIMVPRSEISSLSLSCSREEMQAALASEHYTRYPIYENTIDNIVGIIHIKDIFTQTQQGGNELVFDLRALLRPVLYVPETTPIDAILTQMRSKRIHMAIVIDEYGSTSGIVTLEDIIEEIVGEVQDEFDTREAGVRSEVETLPGGRYSVDGLMSLSSFAEHFGEDNIEDSLEDMHSHTIAGYIFEKLDRIPLLGDHVAFGDYQLKVEEMDGRRISRIGVERRKQKATQDALDSEQKI